MLNKTGVVKTTYGSTNQILFCTEPQVSVGIVVDKTTVTQADATGKKILKAGTPLAGDLTNRLTPFKVANTSGSDAVGVLLHDVDVTVDNANGTLLIFGFVNLDRLDTTTQGKITTNVKTALAGKVTFLK